MAFAFEKLIVYQKVIAYADHICALTEGFPRGYGFLSDQLNRHGVPMLINPLRSYGSHASVMRKPERNRAAIKAVRAEGSSMSIKKS